MTISAALYAAEREMNNPEREALVAAVVEACAKVCESDEVMLCPEEMPPARRARREDRE